MIRSYSSLLRSMPIYQPQLNRTALRSFAPAAGVYSGAPPRPPRPPPCAPAPPAPAPRPLWAGAPAGAAPRPCALAVGGALIVRATAIATPVPIIFCKTAMMISFLVVRVTGGDLDRVTVRVGYRLQKTQRAAVLR